jgi:5-formyltetrahydrofolate cyclo-ligase
MVMQEPNKSQLRIALRGLRQNLHPDLVKQDSARIRERLLELEQIRAARSVMLYLPTRGEVDTWPLLDHFWALGIEVLLPRCRAEQPGVMDIFAVTSSRDFGPGCFGLIEPHPLQARPVPAPRPDVILVPALAFDRQGYRLGFGGGYYDRFLPTLIHAPLLIGLAYRFQVLDRLPFDPWDCPVHLVVTPDQVLNFTAET